MEITAKIELKGITVTKDGVVFKDADIEYKAKVGLMEQISSLRMIKWLLKFVDKTEL